MEFINFNNYNVLLIMHAGTYQRNTGWKYQKRPGVDALLVGLLDHFEIILFTSENAMVCTFQQSTKIKANRWV